MNTGVAFALDTTIVKDWSVYAPCWSVARNVTPYWPASLWPGAPLKVPVPSPSSVSESQPGPLRRVSVRTAPWSASVAATEYVYATSSVAATTGVLVNVGAWLASSSSTIVPRP